MSDDRIAGMEYLLREISILFSNRQGSVTVGEDIYRPWLASIQSLGIWDSGYVITQRLDRPDEFSEAVKKNQAEFVKLNEDLNVQIKELIEARLPTPYRIPDDFLQRTTGDIRAAIRQAYQNHGIDDKDNPC